MEMDGPGLGVCRFIAADKRYYVLNKHTTSWMEGHQVSQQLFNGEGWMKLIYCRAKPPDKQLFQMQLFKVQTPKRNIYDRNSVKVVKIWNLKDTRILFNNFVLIAKPTNRKFKDTEGYTNTEGIFEIQI